MRDYLLYVRASLLHAVVGPPRYLAWLGILVACVAVGVAAYAHQLQQGLIVTHLSQQVSWGAYIANFTFLVGIAAAAVLIVVPTYVYQRDYMKPVVLLSELLAASAMVMCMAFVIVDMGRPDRIMHMVPGIGRLNFPHSILAWDVVVLLGYMLLNLHIPGYLLYMQYRGRRPAWLFYKPFVFIAIFWALSIHTVTAFLYSGLGGRPYWNTAILAPRFLVSAFASGPALLIIAFTVLDRLRVLSVDARVTKLLRNIIVYTLPLNYFLLGCELFKELYTDSVHASSVHYLLFGLHGHSMVAPYIWSGLAMGLLAMGIFFSPRLSQHSGWLVFASGLCVVSIWIEKGMGLIIPGFIPSPAGDLVQYAPSWIEWLVCLGIWALGTLIFTMMARVAIAIQLGTLSADK